jgi:MinD-like ATPase involved in chromosome partitioning or flagellar assembly
VSDDSPQVGDTSQFHDVTDHPTTEFPPYAQSGEPLGEPAGDEETRVSGRPADAEPATRSFDGFRTERRFQHPFETQSVRPAGTHVPPRAWTATQASGFPPAMDNPPPVYHGRLPGAPVDSPYPPAAPVGPYAAYRPAAPVGPYADLSTTSLLRQFKPPPSEGWRRLLYELSGHLINVGESPRIVRYNNLVVQANRPLQGCYRIALLSLKGGVGKTTITATLGATFATIRGDRVVAVDANPDRGTLSQKVPLETPATVRHLLRDAEGIQRYSDVRSYTNQGPSRLEVLASESDPAVSEAFSAEDYAGTVQVLERFYSLVLTDCGTGLMHSAMSAVLAKADTLIVVSSGSVDGARSASATLDWLDAHGHEELVRGSIAVINAIRPRSGKVDLQKVVDHFSRRCRAVRLVPFDPHLEEGAEIDLNRLKRETREALIELAAVVADGFPGDDRSHQHFV